MVDGCIDSRATKACLMGRSLAAGRSVRFSAPSFDVKTWKRRKATGSGASAAAVGYLLRSADWFLSENHAFGNFGVKLRSSLQSFRMGTD